MNETERIKLSKLLEQAAYLIRSGAASVNETEEGLDISDGKLDGYNISLQGNYKENPYFKAPIHTEDELQQLWEKENNSKADAWVQSFLGEVLYHFEDIIEYGDYREDTWEQVKDRLEIPLEAINELMSSDYVWNYDTIREICVESMNIPEEFHEG